jgi:hypothetical protein
MSYTGPLDLCPFGVNKLAFVMAMDNKQDYDQHKNTHGYEVRSEVRADIYNELRAPLLNEIYHRKLTTANQVEEYVTNAYFEEVGRRIGEVLP